MAGILANSASATMLAGDTSADNAVSGYLTAERITLSVSPTGSDYAWTLSAPSSSATARSALDDDDDDTPSFIPDVSGYYVVTVTVDSDIYILRISVAQTAVTDARDGIRLGAMGDAQFTAPATGRIIYESSDQSGLRTLSAADNLGGFGYPLLTPGALADATGDVPVTTGSLFVIPVVTAIRTYTLPTAGATSKDVVFLECRNSGAYATPIVNGGAGAGTLVAAPANGYGYKFAYDGTNWSHAETFKLS